MTTTVVLNADQEEIRAVARRLLTNTYGLERVRELMAEPGSFDTAAWREIAELGWVGIALPEELGGVGFGVVERCLLLEEMGRVLLPGPFFGTAVLAADAVMLLAAREEVADLLAGLVDGSTRAALVCGGDLLSGAPAGGVAATQDDGYRISGESGVSVDAATADTLLVVAATAEGTGLFTVDPAAAGVTRSHHRTIDETRDFGRVTFDRVLARRLDPGPDASAEVAHLLDRATVSLCAEMVGGARRVLELTVQYAKDRQQFGVPIGSFQAIKHRLAGLHVDIDGARELTYLAVDTLESGDRDGLCAIASAAKAAVSAVYVHSAAEAIQLHGGIGFTWEHDVHLYYKRAIVSAEMLGSSADHRERVARELRI